MFLLFYNGPSNSQVDGRLHIGGEDFSPVHKVGEDGRRYRVAYSRTAYTAVISYGQTRFSRDTVIVHGLQHYVLWLSSSPPIIRGSVFQY